MTPKKETENDQEHRRCLRPSSWRAITGT